MRPRFGEGPFRSGVQRPATALTGPDPVDQVCRQRAPKVNWADLLMVRCNGLLGGRRALTRCRLL